MLINLLSCRLGYFMKTGRLGAQGAAPRLIWQDGRPRGGAQVDGSRFSGIPDGI